MAKIKKPNPFGKAAGKKDEKSSIKKIGGAKGKKGPVLK